MDDFYLTAGADDMWQLPSESKVHDIETTEIWLKHSSNKVKVNTHTIDEKSRDEWLSRHAKGSGKEAQSLLGRFVWLVADNDNINLSQRVREILLEKFGLNLAHTYFKSFTTGITALPRKSKPEYDRRAYAFCYGPKIAAIWSHTIFKGERAGQCVTEGLIFMRAPPPKTDADGKPVVATGAVKNPQRVLQGFLETIPLSPSVCRSSAFPAYLFSLLQSREISKTQADIARRIREVEGRTGFHYFESRPTPIDRRHLGNLAAKVGGFATKLAGVDRKRNMAEKLLNFITRNIEDDARHKARLAQHAENEVADSEEEHPLKCSAETLRERLEMQAMDTEYTKKRVEIQIEGVSRE